MGSRKFIPTKNIFNVRHAWSVDDSYSSQRLDIAQAKVEMVDTIRKQTGAENEKEVYFIDDEIANVAASNILYQKASIEKTQFTSMKMILRNLVTSYTNDEKRLFPI